MGNLETGLASSIVTVTWAASVASAIMWFGGSSSPSECFGPTRYSWDLGLWLTASEAIIRRPESSGGWGDVPYGLAFYDYIGYNPAKGGLFESFPTLLVDSSGLVRADQPFRRAESKYALERVGLSATFSGGALDGIELMNRPSVSGIVRRAQFGELLEFDRRTMGADGVLRTSPRGWFTFAHLTLGLLFLFGHWWYASRTLFRDLVSGIDKDASIPATFGGFLKVGDSATKWLM